MESYRLSLMDDFKDMKDDSRKVVEELSKCYEVNKEGGSYKVDKENQEHQKFYENFLQYTTYSTIVVIVIVALMAIFLV